MRIPAGRESLSLGSGLGEKITPACPDLWFRDIDRGINSS